MRAKTFGQLLNGLPFHMEPPTMDAGGIQITGVTDDNRKVQPGNVFVAYQGVAVDGHKFIPDAIRRGAVAVVCERPLDGKGVPCVIVPNGRQALAYLCAAWHDFPGHSMVMIGVTGTDGKTTTSNLLFSILKAARLNAGIISTVNAVIGERVLDTGLHTTTPDADEVQDYLAQMRDAGMTHCVLEVTSHGLAQYRVDGCDFDVAVVTNITHEHLDLHGSYEAYRAAKARLFEMVAYPPHPPPC
ncbi:MAG: Mur ligase family protein, partial [Chloroflexi bacterium]|nr:Mur ligase family protein [Chloroflexota bacterium]